MVYVQIATATPGSGKPAEPDSLANAEPAKVKLDVVRSKLGGVCPRGDFVVGACGAVKRSPPSVVRI